MNHLKIIKSRKIRIHCSINSEKLLTESQYTQNFTEYLECNFQLLTQSFSKNFYGRGIVGSIQEQKEFHCFLWLLSFLESAFVALGQECDRTGHSNAA